MTTQAINNCTVMFADVAGSTKLYEELGDVIANRVVSEVLDLMEKITLDNQGKVIKTIGDEIMSSFDSANDAANAAIQIQEKLEFGVIQGTYVAVRIGFHSGSAILQSDGDIFGDTVNIAARMTGIAKARQIILSQTTAAELDSDLNEKARNFDKVQVKGKAEAINISELVWENAGVTQMISFDSFVTQLKQELTLKYNGIEYRIDTLGKNLQLGRSSSCDIVVDAKLVSRFHASIRIKRGSFVLVDQSTNGTYTQTSDGSRHYLRRDELILQRDGVISLGKKITDQPDHLIQYSVKLSNLNSG